MNLKSVFKWLKFPLLGLSLTAAVVFSNPPESAKDDFDRLDGHGPSRVRVDVVEWEGNLEIHVYPKGSLMGLALKQDRRNQNKPVMVIGYRFSNAPEKQLIRRAVLGIPLAEQFSTFKDPTVPDYDKIIITNHSLDRPLVRYRLDPAPTQLYPDGHPALAKNSESEKTSEREPAASTTPVQGAPNVVDEDSGTIQPFGW